MSFRSGLSRPPFFESRLPPEEILSTSLADLPATILICPAVSANLFAGCFLAAICACQGAACALANGATAEIDVPAFSGSRRLNSLHGSPWERKSQDRAGPTRDAPGRGNDRPAMSCTRRGSIRARRTRTNLRDNPPPAKQQGARRSCQRWAVLSWVRQGDARLRVTVQTAFLT